VFVGDWEDQLLRGGFQHDTSIHRLSGTTSCDGSTRNWSLILKIVYPSVTTTDLQRFAYWKREALAYQSGFLDDLPGGLVAPRCYSISDQPDGSVWIWMEDLKDEMPGPWSIKQHAQVAYRLGEFNGAYLAGRPLPAGPWVDRQWLRQYVESAAPMITFIRQNPAHPLVQSLFPGISLPMTLSLWDEYPYFLTVLGSLPQTFCHQDAFRRNLFIRGDQVIAIDWSYAGIAPVGAEIVPLVGAAFQLTKFPSSQAKDLDRSCFRAYLDGLREAGWTPDPRQVRKGYSLTLVLRYVLGATIGQALLELKDEETRQQWAEAMEMPVEKAGESDPGIAAYYTSIGIEALRSLGPVAFSRFFARTARYALQLNRKPRGNR
jgi:hypothetical protein